VPRNNWADFVHLCAREQGSIDSAKILILYLESISDDSKIFCKIIVPLPSNFTDIMGFPAFLGFAILFQNCLI
jgi:hypothetical protein